MTSLALTMGEPGGIGPELALKAWQHFHKKSQLTFTLYADLEMMRASAERLGLDVDCVDVSNENTNALFAKALPVIPLHAPVTATPGQAETKNAAAVIEAITRAVVGVHAGHYSAVVTNPVQKASLTAHGFKWPGQTEFLGHLDQLHTKKNNRAVMMLACDTLKIVPLTIHMPLKDVAARLSREEIISVTQLTHDALRFRFKIAAPRIVIAGFNPHAGENGTMGREEIDIIAPAVKTLRDAGLNVIGPLPADTLFHERARARYDAVVAMYHDQALIPVKTLAFDSAVNMTIGLSFLRTSPDHGTALDIAGKGIARADSLIAALEMAAQLS